ncbi:hypothetical protein [Porphyromonas cangingivalis]|uniref:hypothetical protein n=1 Tax=Porphyromonas cangingivalis TaxID=36874 RepID=UPI00051CC7CF|nr:hypothetical protein [Porphyromonas cangingivalis]KGL47821.1 hypothetical protein HQ34_08630 [Porphyromonas cangingivalis]
MKNLICLITLVLVFFGCKEETVSVKTTEIILGSSLVRSLEGQIVSVPLSGGDGKRYSVWPESSLVADAKIFGDTLTIMSKSEGTQKFTIVSRGKQAFLTIEVKSVPNLGDRLGIYGLDGTALFQYQMFFRQSSKGFFIIKNVSDVYASRMFLPLVDKGVNIGDTIPYSIVSEGLGDVFEDTDADGRVYSVIVERLQGKYVQLRSDNLRIITNVRE